MTFSLSAKPAIF